MIRWALVAFVIAVIASIADISGRGPLASLSGDVAIAALLFGVIVTVITWVSRDQVQDDQAVGRPWSP